MPPPANLTIRTTGLVEMRKAMRNLGREYRRAFDRELRRIGRPIADDAKRRYRARYPRRRGGRGSQRGIRSSARRGSSTVSLGSARYPYLLGQEWGSNRYPQFPERRTDGHFFWPAIEQGGDEVYDRLLTLVDQANRLAFPEGR